MLIRQCEPHGVSICVSDNASSYDVTALLEPLQRGYPFLEVSRADRNYGMGANFLRVVEMAESTYAWLFSDDDLLADGAIQQMLAACERDAFDLVIANREYLTLDLR
jgi:GT2 family glycosyltransferase